MAKLLKTTLDHDETAQMLEQLPKVYAGLDDASVEDEHRARSPSSPGRLRSRQKSLLSQPVLSATNIEALLDGARQSRAFAKRVGAGSA